MDKKYIYVVTRFCLEQGSLSILRYLASMFPSEGPVTLLDQSGKEFQGMISAHQILGLSDFYQENNVQVNDILYICPTSAKKYRLEHISKPHLAGNEEISLGAPHQAKVIVLQENQYVRELIIRQSNKPLTKKISTVNNYEWSDNEEEPDDIQSSIESKPNSGNIKSKIIEFFAQLGYSVEDKNEYILLKADQLPKPYRILLFLENIPDQTLIERLQRLNNAEFSAIWHEDKINTSIHPTLTINQAIIDKLLRINTFHPIDLTRMIGLWNTQEPESFIKSLEREAADIIKARSLFAKFVSALEIYRPGESFSARDLDKLIENDELTVESINKWLDCLADNPFFVFDLTSEGQYKLNKDTKRAFSEIASYFSDLSSQLSQ